MSSTFFCFNYALATPVYIAEGGGMHNMIRKGK